MEREITQKAENVRAGLATWELRGPKWQKNSFETFGDYVWFVETKAKHF